MSGAPEVHLSLFAAHGHVLTPTRGMQSGLRYLHCLRLGSVHFAPLKGTFGSWDRDQTSL